MSPVGSVQVQTWGCSRTSGLSGTLLLFWGRLTYGSLVHKVPAKLFLTPRFGQKRLNALLNAVIHSSPFILFYDPVFFSPVVTLKDSLSIHMLNHENIVLLTKKIYSIRHSNFFIYNKS